MSRLKMITQSDPKPRNIGGVQMKTLPKVYFAAHPKDYNTCREQVAKEIFRTHNCVLCYDSQPETPYDAAVLSDLEHMSLFVLPITVRLLTDPVQRRVLEVDLPFAEAHHIPVLPLMQENGLEALYGKIEQLRSKQALNPYAEDLTALAYADKLKNFLDDVLLGQEDSQAIRDAFAAKIFLSYRKKDRALARELMRTIHQDPLLRDVAIWYDEFLTLGEDFNAEIGSTIGKSHLFLLAVTPNLMETGNYVIRYEYPAALEEGKQVLPVQVEKKKPVRKAFRQTFLTSGDADTCSKIKELVRGMVDVEQVCNALKESLAQILGKPLTENNTPRQTYLMGLAYLNGLEVEADQDRALALLTRSAEDGYPLAMAQLLQMYANGRGVAKNLDAALDWNGRLVDWYRHKYSQNSDMRLREAILRVQGRMLHTLYHMQQPHWLQTADTLCGELLEGYKDLYTPAENPELFAELYMSRSAILFELGHEHHNRAMACLQEGLRLEKQAYLAAGAGPTARYALLRRYALGAVCCMKHNKSSFALDLLQQGQELYGPDWETEDDAAFLRAKATIVGYRGLIRKDLPDLLWALQTQQRLERHKADPKQLYWLSAVSLCLAECVFEAQPEPEKRFAQIDEALCAAEQYARTWMKQGDLNGLDHLCLVLCTQIKLYWQMPACAGTRLQEAYQHLEQEVMAHPIGPQLQRGLAFRVLGQKWEDLGDAALRKRDAQQQYAKAEGCYRDSLLCLEGRSASNPVDATNHSELYRSLGVLCTKQDKLEEADACFTKSGQLLEDFMLPYRDTAEGWKAFLESKTGQQMMDSYLSYYRDTANRWVEYYENNRWNPQNSRRARDLLDKGLQWAEEWRQTAPCDRACWSAISLRVLQERLSWAAEEYAWGYSCNEAILQLCAELGKRDQSTARQYAELRAACSMGRQAILLKNLSGQTTKLSPYVHFERGEKLAKGLLEHRETPEVRILLYTCRFFLAGFLRDAKQRRRAVRQVWENVLALHRQCPSAESEHLLKEISDSINRV